MTMTSLMTVVTFLLLIVLQIFLSRLVLSWLGLILPIWFFFDAFMSGFTYVLYLHPQTATIKDGIFVFLQKAIPGIICLLIYFFFKWHKNKNHPS